MLPPAEVRTSGTKLLAARAARPAWGVPCQAVAGVRRFSEWSGEPPLDVAALLGEPTGAAPELDARVVLLGMERGDLPLLTRNALSLLHAEPDQLLALPDAFRRASPWIDQVALVDGEPALFVLSPERLMDAWRRSERPPLAPPTLPIR